MPVVLQVERADALRVEAAQPAMEIAGLEPEEQPADEAQHRIAEIAVQRRHGAGGDPALEPVAHDEVGAAAQARDERLERTEIVGVVRVAHDDEAAVRGLDAAAQRRAIALLRDRHDAGAQIRGDLLRAVGAAVVGDQDLAGDACGLQISAAP